MKCFLTHINKKQKNTKAMHHYKHTNKLPQSLKIAKIKVLLPPPPRKSYGPHNIHINMLKAIVSERGTNTKRAPNKRLITRPAAVG